MPQQTIDLDSLKKNYPELLSLWKQLKKRVNKHGPRSPQVREFVQKHRATPNILHIAITTIVTADTHPHPQFRI